MPVTPEMEAGSPDDAPALGDLLGSANVPSGLIALLIIYNKESFAMAASTHTMFPPTLVFTSVDAFLHAVQQRSIPEIGCTTLKRIKPFSDGMLERHTSFILLTAHDHIRDEVLTCSVFLKAGDFIDRTQLFTPAAEWERQNVRAELVRQQVVQYVHAVPNIHVVDAAYHVHPDVGMRFATFTLDEASHGDSACV